MIEAGKVIESGTHSELLAQAGKYHAYFRMQFAAAEAKACSADAEDRDAPAL